MSEFCLRLFLTGRRDLGKFIRLCRKHGLYVILRVGPFDQGEVRNGGLPDWLYGKPFEVRKLSDGFLSCVRKLYTQIAAQVEGQFFQDRDPINIAITIIMSKSGYKLLLLYIHDTMNLFKGLFVCNDESS